MREGVELATDVCLPPGDEPRPALLQRTPYGKNVPLIVSLTFEPADAVARGYAVVVQDCRGCGGSDGEFHAFVDERADGHDTIEWVSAQPWCDGRVGVYGSSYMGATAFQAAIDAPAALRVAMAYLTGPNYHDGWVYTGGAFELGLGLRWSFDQAERIAGWRDSARADEIRELVARFRADPIGFCGSSFDLRALPGLAELPHWREWLDHPEYDDFWRSLDVVAAADEGRLGVPLLQVAAWYDPFARGQIALHNTLGGDHRLVVGPWDHNAYLSPETLTTAGARDFGEGAAGGRVGVGPLALDWFDRWLGSGADDGLPPVRYFAIGPDEWRSAEEWPPPHETKRWYLRSGGLLATAPPEQEPADSLPYDPESPAPTLGGRHVLGYVPSGVQDQRRLAVRDDVLVYASHPLAEPLTVAGPIRLEVHLRSSASPADVVVTVVDVDPSGAAWNVAEGILRLQPTTGAVTVELGEAAYEFARGHRLGLHVTSSSFPRFDRSPVPATRQVLHDGAHPSALVLPVQA
jgi:putative CocE/NonD family hydrolase